MGFGKLGLPELILILAIALVIFGPSKLPEIGKSMGRALNEFKSQTNKKDKEDKEDKEDKSENKEDQNKE